jgi:hypothetical protein
MTTTDNYQEHIQNLNEAVTSNLPLIDGLNSDKQRAVVEAYENLLKKILDIED